MKYLFLDVETTGLNSSEDEIASLGFILSDKSLVYETGNEFFSLSKKDVEPEAYIVNGLYRNKLAGLSRGEFYDYIPKLYKILVNTDIIVGHNVNFDLDFIKSYGVYYIDKEISKKEIIDTRVDFTNIIGVEVYKDKKRFTSYPSLEEAMSMVINSGVSVDSLHKEYNYLFKDKKGTYHSASYDAFCCFKLLSKLKGW